MKLDSISTETLRVLQKALDAEVKKRDDLNPGTYTVGETLTMSVSGTVVKNDAEWVTPTVHIAHKVAMALLVRHCGITGKYAVAALESAMRSALEADKKSEEYIAAMNDIEAAEAMIEASLASLPKVQRAGKTLINKPKVE